VPAAQVAVVVRDAKEVVDIAFWRDCRLGVLVHHGRREEVGQVEAGERVLHLCLDLRVWRRQRFARDL